MLVITEGKITNPSYSNEIDSICYYYFDGLKMNDKAFKKCLIKFQQVVNRHNVPCCNFYPFNWVDWDEAIAEMLLEAAEQTYSTVYLFDNSKYTEEFMKIKELMNETGVELVVVPFDRKKCRGILNRISLKHFCG